MVVIATSASLGHAQPREEIRLTTIIPDQQVLRVKKGIISTTNYRQATFPDSNVQANSLLVEGNVGIGTTNPISILDIASENPINGGDNDVSMTTFATSYSNDSAFKVRGARGTKNSPQAMLAGDRLGSFLFQGYDGSAFRSGAGIIGEVEQNFSSSEYATALDFQTTDGIVTTSKVIIKGNGYVGIGTTNPGATLEVKGTMKVFGAWEAKSKDTVYRAATDGFVSAIGTASTGWTDSNNPPTTQRTSSSNFDGQCFMPVRKGDYWKITGDAHTVYWIPLGS
jgi:hypothetical protein